MKTRMPLFGCRVFRAALRATLFVPVLSFVVVPFARADASANSVGSDWFADKSGWQWDWPGINRAPGGNLVGEYKHWFETGEPAAWTTHGPAIWTLPATTAGFPSWPFSLKGSADENGGGAASGDAHGCVASSGWRWEAFNNALFPGSVVLRKGVAAYANAQEIPYDATAAHSRTRFRDPWEFTNPAAGTEWSVMGRVAPRGSLAVNEGYGGTASAFFDLNYSLAVDGGTAFEILDLHVGADETGMPNLTLTYAPGLHFFRGGVEISAATILNELAGFYTPDGNWLLAGDTGETLDFGYHFDVMYRLAGDTSSAVLYSDPSAGADETRAGIVPEPAATTGLGAAVLGLAGLIRRGLRARAAHRRG